MPPRAVRCPAAGRGRDVRPLRRPALNSAVWVYPIVIVVCYMFQQWGYKVYTLERDMTVFNQKYPKGRALFVLLSLYEGCPSC